MTDTDKSPSRGLKKLRKELDELDPIPSTQIREKLLRTFTDYWKNDVIDVPRAMEYLESLFKAELNQLIEEVKAKKHNQQLPHNPTDEQRCRFYRDGGYNFALDLAKQVIVKRIEGI